MSNAWTGYHLIHHLSIETTDIWELQKVDKDGTVVESIYLEPSPYLGAVKEFNNPETSIDRIKEIIREYPEVLEK